MSSTHPLLFTFYSLNLHQFAPIGEAHVALLHECLVHAEGSAQVVTGVALGGVSGAQATLLLSTPFHKIQLNQRPYFTAKAIGVGFGVGK